LNQLNLSIEQDTAGRLDIVRDEIGFIREREQGIILINKLVENNDILLRITHNDTKSENIIFSEDNRAICLIDLATVMQGYVLYDFGDAVRTIACKAKEDEQNLDLVNLDLSIFRAFSKGFLNKTKSFLTKAERENLPYSARLMTYLMAIRFLTDYLNGDRYYRIQQPDHNLIRARVQIKIIQLLEQNQQEMELIIKN